MINKRTWSRSAIMWPVYTVNESDRAVPKLRHTHLLAHRCWDAVWPIRWPAQSRWWTIPSVSSLRGPCLQPRGSPDHPAGPRHTTGTKVWQLCSFSSGGFSVTKQKQNKRSHFRTHGLQQAVKTEGDAQQDFKLPYHINIILQFMDFQTIFTNFDYYNYNNI